jgi:hypothetical protein
MAVVERPEHICFDAGTLPDRNPNPTLEGNPKVPYLLYCDDWSIALLGRNIDECTKSNRQNNGAQADQHSGKGLQPHF